MNFLKKIFDKLTPKKQSQQVIPETPKTTIISQEKETSKTQPILEKSDEEIIAELNTLAPGIFSHLKTSQEKRFIISIYRKMIEDGVNPTNEKEVEKWIEKNQHLISPNYQKIETYRRDKPKIGRNDPCPCGSGKKYKKCCGANT